MNNIILCGGSGTRLWPLSRTMLPKQFVKIFGEKSLFQMTEERNRRLCSSSLIVCNAEQFFLASDQLEESSKAVFLLEPIGRNTAPAIALACMLLEPEEIVLVTASDHLIKKQSAYEEAVKTAENLARQDYLVTFGITPDYPETGYGYIEADGADVLRFKEKPAMEKAERYMHANAKLAAKNLPAKYLWNSGMFCFKAGVFLDELKKYSPAIFETSAAALNNKVTVQERQYRIKHEDMLAIPADSIDYAVMEKSDRVKVVPCDIGWSDLGSFDSLYAETEAGENGNSVIAYSEGSPELVCVDSTDNLVISSERQIALVDIEGLLVVDTSDALLISKKGSSQKVKAVTEAIKKLKPELTETHRFVHRPWGTYEVLLESSRYKIKRIVVKTGRKLSLQKHFHRSEHWVVVSGTATVTVGDKRFYVHPNESTYIPAGQVHRLENEGKVDLAMIEVQVGEYVGEDDIVRIDDIYGR
ncbi:mannose-1-phosphate guanylyltransferase/mannose-6-phosphate isomerase [Geovibrio thiophilus]|uniref:mannose-1-phosphate guanylyltransferase n=1 Tax=Geovibrio thiophilus TaxID=139438 RepID=A0A410K1F3_9BACT|nr:mannose-1-phosphate guanylyltransferase/mannose-6-phosphate isomerase [Geovibrio thiophilus]QAR34183.1 mannose-1-phosphate guanylyltransferase/mannose-6-phosphate isomerase [Geovibrio thiophilus]